MMLDRLQSFHALPNWDIPSYSLSYSQVIPRLFPKPREFFTIALPPRAMPHLKSLVIA